MTYWCVMIRFANLLQAPTVSIYQLVKTITFVLYLFDMVEMNKMEMRFKDSGPQFEFTDSGPQLAFTGTG